MDEDLGIQSGLMKDHTGSHGMGVRKREDGYMADRPENNGQIQVIKSGNLSYT